MIWLNAIRRWLGYPEHPAATSGDTSVLFVLQSHSPRSFEDIRQATNIEPDDLVETLRSLQRAGRVEKVDVGASWHSHYAIVHKQKEG